jgi:hypothetical protein
MRTEMTRGERFRLRLAADIARQAAVKGAAIVAIETALADTVDALGETQTVVWGSKEAR